MPSRDELEQDLRIVEAERDAAEKRAYEAEKELAALRGQQALMIQRAPELAEIDPAELDERRELEVLRHGVDADLEALNELRHPSGALLKHEAPESVLDVVRANQRERAELQQRTAAATTLLSRIAALVKLDRWDEAGGDKLLERLQAQAMIAPKLQAALKQHKRELAALPELEAEDVTRKVARAMHAGAISALEKALAMPIERPPVDVNAPRRIVFQVSGHDVAMTVKPDDTVAQVREAVLATVYPEQTRPPVPFEQFLIFDESGKPLLLDKAMRDVHLPSERVVITTPAGFGG